MADKIDPVRRSANMRAIRSKDTTPEMAVRRLVHGLGYRYRLHGKDLPGKPDLVFRKSKKAIFVHGCFWHQHAECIDGRKPKSNSGYWNEKLDRNVERDRRNRRELEKRGWDVLVLWECEAKNPDLVRQKVCQFLG